MVTPSSAANRASRSRCLIRNPVTGSFLLGQWRSQDMTTQEHERTSCSRIRASTTGRPYRTCSMRQASPSPRQASDSRRRPRTRPDVQARMVTRSSIVSKVGNHPAPIAHNRHGWSEQPRVRGRAAAMSGLVRLSDRSVWRPAVGAQSDRSCWPGHRPRAMMRPRRRAGGNGHGG